MLVSKYLVLTAMTGAAPCAHPWQTWHKRQGRKEKRVRKKRKRLWEQGKQFHLKKWPAMPQRSTNTPSWRFYLSLDLLCSHIYLVNLLSTNISVINQCFDHPLTSWRPPDDFWPSLPLSILKAQALHSSSPWHCMPRSYSSTVPVLSNHLSVLNFKNMKFSPSKNLERQNEILSLPTWFGNTNRYHFSL